jgi:tubulin polyglutamylase TTLL5
MNTEYQNQWLQLPQGLGLGLSWNLLWTWSKPHINKSHLLIWQKVNHFDDSKQLTRKDLLKKNIQRFTDMKDNKYASEFEIMPQTFLLPNEYTQFVQCFKDFENMNNPSKNPGDENQPSESMVPKKLVLNYWILKPVGLSRGRGISVIQNLNDVVYSQSSVIQKYVENPLTLQNYKFDLRLFIVVTSFKPLEAFIYRDGFARISSYVYSLNPNDLANKFIHLTNSSIQKQNLQGFTQDNPINQVQDDPNAAGSKLSLLGENGLWKRLEQFSALYRDSSDNSNDKNNNNSKPANKKIVIDELWQSICLLVVKSLSIVDEKMVSQPNCFELFGYDVLIDDTLRPWLLEVNASPSLARENYLDKRIKNQLIKDIVQLLDVAQYDRLALCKIIKKRLGLISKNRYCNGKNDLELEKDLKEILGSDYIPRRYGELPKNMGNFERLCPETTNYLYVQKIKKKIFKTMD